MLSHATAQEGPSAGLGIEMGRPHTSASNLLGPLVRPGTSGSSLRGSDGPSDSNRDDAETGTVNDRERRKSLGGGGFLRGTINALKTGRRKDRPDAHPTEADDRPKTSSAASSLLRDEDPGDMPKGPGFSWTGRTKTGL